MTKYYSNKLGEISLGKKIGSGGEGDVYTINGNEKLLAKLYRNKNDVMEEKITYMTSLYKDDMAKFCAWPYSTITQNGKFCGFVMPSFPNCSSIYSYIHPVSRRNRYPDITWKKLAWIAYNLCVAVHNIHKNGYVLGDINDNNVLVSKEGMVYIIDSDSFQIKSPKKTYRCSVGVPEFTPPELQKLSSFNETDRTQNNDLFGLAVLIFELLFMGRHPYVGTPSFDDNKIPYINHLFPYSSNMTKSYNYKQPPQTLPLNVVSEPIRYAFESAFLHDFQRCTALQWGNLLLEFMKSLRCCRCNKSHFFFERLSSCPWCDMEAKHGLVFFVESASSINLGESGTAKILQFNDAKLNAERKKLPTMLPAKLSVNFQPRKIYKLTPKPLPLDIKMNLTWWKKLFYPDNASKLQNEIINRRTHLSEVYARYNKIDQEWEYYQQAVDVYNVYNSLITIGEKIDKLPQVRNEKIANFSAAEREKQLRKFMSQSIINQNTHINGIGEKRKKTLFSMGIVTAWDVKQRIKSKMFIKGLNYTVIDELLAWSQRVEKRFVFRNTQMTPEDIRKIDQEVRELGNKLRNEFEEEYVKFKNSIKINEAKRIALTHAMEEITIVKCQAECDYNYALAAK